MYWNTLTEVSFSPIFKHYWQTFTAWQGLTTANLRVHVTFSLTRRHSRDRLQSPQPHQPSDDLKSTGAGYIEFHTELGEMYCVMFKSKPIKMRRDWKGIAPFAVLPSFYVAGPRVGRAATFNYRPFVLAHISRSPTSRTSCRFLVTNVPRVMRVFFTVCASFSGICCVISKKVL